MFVSVADEHLLTTHEGDCGRDKRPKGEKRIFRVLEYDQDPTMANTLPSSSLGGTQEARSRSGGLQARRRWKKVYPSGNSRTWTINDVCSAIRGA